MALERMNTLLNAARANKVALGAFECWDSLNIQGIAQAAARCQSPVIFQATPMEYGSMGGPDALHCMVNYYVEKYKIDAALHLDHGSTLEDVENCVRHGFTSVMLDASTLPFEENLKLSSEAARIAHKYDADCEAELGHVGGGDAGTTEAESVLTLPDEAEEFVRRSRVDCLAVSIGTIHGEYRGKPELRLDRLTEIARRIEVPLVLHGGSGTPPEQLLIAIGLGVAKINICTDISKAFLSGIKYAEANLSLSQPGNFYRPAMDTLSYEAERLIRLFRRERV